MPTAMIEPTGTVASLSRTQRLRRFLGAYWLRPENALWMALRSEVLAGTPWHRPCVDISCGDGVFSFLHAGGVFDDDFDVFWGVAPPEAVAGFLSTARAEACGSGSSGRHADLFDHVGERYRPRVVRSPDLTIDVGTDWKPNLLTKAGLLGLYEELIVHDNHQPMPLEDGTFRTVYSNSIYWVSNIDAHLSDIRRITADHGRVLLEVKLDSVLRYRLENHRRVLGDRFLEIIGRGRAETWPSIADRATWERRFQRAGLVIERAVPFITRTHAHLWDVGLRPVAPLLIELANSVSPETRSRVKRRWVDLFCDLCAPLCDPQVDLLSGKAEPAEILYELRPA